jgi:prephenate dehydrogenase
MNSTSKTIAVVGLGLIGGSMALALRGFRKMRIIGVDSSSATCRLARKAGIEVEASLQSVLERADVAVFCVYPETMVELVGKYIKFFKPGCVVTDVTGVKVELTRRVSKLLPKTVDYVSAHPMAGREKDGFKNADAALFKGAGFLITPVRNPSPKSIELIRDMGHHIGATRFAVVSPKEHDRIIAYTSHATHLTAVALTLGLPKSATPAFCAGAFRDATRVANINDVLWGELMMQNRGNVLKELASLQRHFKQLEEALQKGGVVQLRKLFRTARMKKMKNLKSQI